MSGSTRPPAPTPEEAEWVLSRISDPQARAMLRLSWDACLKVSVLVALRWDQVDEAAGALLFPVRRVPMSLPLRDALAELPRRSVWLFPTRSAAGGCLTRVSAFRICRKALTAAGREDLAPDDLRRGAIEHRVQTQGVRATAVFTGLEMNSLQSFLHNHGKVPPSRRYPKPVRPRADNAALAAALEREGDTFAAQAAVLSWLGGLKIYEIETLRWEDVSLAEGRWSLRGVLAPIPPAILPYLTAWAAAGEGTGPVLRRRHSGRAPTQGFVSRQMEEFFVRHGLDGLSLELIRGRGAIPPEQQAAQRSALESRILAQAATSAGATPNWMQRVLHVPLRQARWDLARMEEAGRLRRGSDGHYFLPGAASRREQFDAFVERCRREGRPVLTTELRQAYQWEDKVAGYFLKSAVDRGVLVREKTGRYRVL